MTINYREKIEHSQVYAVARHTPLDEMPNLSARFQNRILLKREDMQPVFSFKLRGAYHKMANLSPEALARGVICASAGNHAQGVALSAQKMGCRAMIVMPTTTPAIKVNAVRSRGAEVVLIGDFLDTVEETQAWLRQLAERGARAHLVEVADPAEESFPYAGRTEFTDPETGDKLTAGRAERLAQDYRHLYAARRAELAAWCKRLGWSFTTNHTDRLASEALVRLHLAMGDDGGYGGSVRP